MKTSIEFYKKESGEISRCSDTLDIEVSSRGLSWERLILEKGSSPCFYPDDVYTKGFYFALDIGESLSWKAKKDGKMIDLKTTSGSIWINPPGVSFTHEIDETCYFILLSIDREVLYWAFDGVFPQEELQFLNNYNIDDMNLKNMMEMFYNEVLNQGRNGEFYLHSLVKLFANYFIRNYSDYEDLIHRRAEKSVIDDRDIEDIIGYIDERIGENIAIEDLASTLNMSKFHLLREFKKATGITPYKFIINRKMDRAQILLRDSEDSIAEIAYRLGFNDQSHFSNTFKKHFSQTPNQYRRSKD